MKLTKNIIIFLVLNFSALAVGGFFTSDGVSSEWYLTMNKAPWSPPGWVFGFAWTIIMICYSIYMAFLVSKVKNKKIAISIYTTQLFLNIIWNPLFFYFQKPSIALISIASLTVVVTYFLLQYNKVMKWSSLLIFPYFIWLLIATSLNFYIVLYN